MKKIIPIISRLLIFISSFLIIFTSASFMWSYQLENFYKKDKLPGFVPKSENIKLVNAGFDNFFADLYWLKTVQYVGANARSESYPILYEYLDLVTDLDKNFTGAYKFGALLLPLVDQTEEAVLLLEKGREKMPDNWEILWQLGFVKYFYMEEFEEAAEIYDECALLEDCLPGAERTAANLRLKTGKYKMALDEYSRIFLDEKSDESSKDLALKRIKLINKLIKLNELAKNYFEESGQEIQNMKELKNYFSSYEAELFESEIKNNPFIVEEGKVKTKLW